MKAFAVGRARTKAAGRAKQRHRAGCFQLLHCARQFFRFDQALSTTFPNALRHPRAAGGMLSGAHAYEAFRLDA
jgi:hypothetical protein